MDNRNTISSADQELLKQLSPDLFASLQKGERFADATARAFLVSKKREKQQDKIKNDSDKPEQQPKQQMLPIVFEQQTIAPVCMLRGALFSVVRSGRRSYFKVADPQRVFTMKNIEIERCGEQTDQNDLDVYEALLYLYSREKKDFTSKITHEHQTAQQSDINQPLPHPVKHEDEEFVRLETTVYEILKVLGKKRGGGERKLLRQRIMRLSGNIISVRVRSKEGKKMYEYNGTMLGPTFQSTEDKNKTWEWKWIININKRIADLFGENQYAIIDLKIKQSLGKNQLAKWLYQFYSTHNEPYSFSFEKLMLLSGYLQGMKNFKRDVKSAFAVIKKTCEDHGKHFIYIINGETVSVSWDEGGGKTGA